MASPHCIGDKKSKTRLASVGSTPMAISSSLFCVSAHRDPLLIFQDLESFRFGGDLTAILLVFHSNCVPILHRF